MNADQIPDETAVLPHEARNALIALLKNGVIMQGTKHFDNLCRYKSILQTQLSNLYLRLLLDERAGLAILLQEQHEDEDKGETSSLIIARTLSVYDTLLLLVLRTYYQKRETAGEQRVFTDIDNIANDLQSFLPLTNYDKADRKKLNSAVDKMKERCLLNGVRGDDTRFEISPAIRHVVNAEYLEKMLAEYQRLLDEHNHNAQA
jgi:hypothetical protein